MSLSEEEDPAVGPTDRAADSSLESTARFDRDELVRGWRGFEEAAPRIVPLVKFAAKTDMGQVRENNEDKFEFYEPEAPGILAHRGSVYAVADGMGGALAGQIASELMLKQVIAGYYDHPSSDPTQAMYEAVVQANDRIYHLAQMIPERSGMGTTLVGLMLIEDRVLVVQVGDSRVYRIREGEIEQITHDHSWVEEQVRAGMMSRSEAEKSPFRNVITRSVGAMPAVMPDFYEDHVRPGDIWVLCSDGLTGHVEAPEIGRIAGTQSPSEAARQLIELANGRGGRDNITVFVVAIRALLNWSDLMESGKGDESSPGSATDVQNAASLPHENVPSASAIRPRSVWRKLFGLP